MNIKKLLALAAGLALTAVVAMVPVSAASPMNANEKAVYDKWFNGVTVSGKTFAPVDNLQGVVTNYFIRDDVEMTAQQKDEIIGYIDAAYAIKDTSEVKALAKGDTIDLSKLPQDQKKTLLSNAQKAGAVMGLTVVYQAEGNKIVITDNQGAVVCDTAAVVKKTGETSNTLLTVTAISLIALLGAAVVVASKKQNA